jgi:hypothetical protein
VGEKTERKEERESALSHVIPNGGRKHGGRTRDCFESRQNIWRDSMSPLAHSEVQCDTESHQLHWRNLIQYYDTMIDVIKKKDRTRNKKNYRII